jgi:mannose-1-phosphate guanylyltransferase
MKNKALAVILAGGSGTRFYPLSTEDHPKQFLDLSCGGSMLHQTFERILPLFSPQDIFVSSNSRFREKVHEHLPALAPESGLWEPAPKNTAPCLGLMSLIAARKSPDTVIVSLHSDHVITKEARFLSLLKEGIDVASRGEIVTLGIKPDYAETGYGYIQANLDRKDPLVTNPCYFVESFHEKPDLERAKSYLESGNYFWNAGLFIFQAGVMLEEMAQHSPVLYQGLRDLEPELDDFFSEEFEHLFCKLPSISIDVAVMEKTKKIKVLPADVGWSDLGSYLSLHELWKKDSDNNAWSRHPQAGQVSSNSRNNLIIQKNKGKRTALLGVDGLMVVDTEDCLLVGRLDASQDVKVLLSKTSGSKS